MRSFISTELKEQAIIESVLQLHSQRRPVLLGTATITASERLHAKLVARGVPVQVLNGKQPQDEAALIAKAGHEGAITIATNMAGRGTDIKLGPGVAALGGLHVIVSEPQESSRSDRQLIGRAARQGDPGSCQGFVAAEDALLQKCAPALAERMLQIANFEGEIERDLSLEVLQVQRECERREAQQRQQMFARDRWLDAAAQTLGAPG